jgi:hypothetical protein
MEESWLIPTNNTLNKNMKIIDAGRNPSNSIEGI